MSVPDAHYCIIGHVNDPEYKERIQHTCRKENVADSVTFIYGLEPDSHDLVDAYHAADVFLMPSSHEPFGIAILEAWAAACPVVAARVGGIPDFTDNEINALLYPSNDDAACAAAISNILLKKSYADSLARAGNSKARTYFDWSISAQRLASLYSHIRTEYNAHTLDK